MNSVISGLKKFKHDLEFVQSNSQEFSLWLHIELWIKDFLFKKSPLDAGFPWINYSVIQFLHHYINPKMQILEFGAGGSSIFFLNRGVNLFSIEHEEIWIDKVKKRVPLSEFARWSPNLVLPRERNFSIPNVDDYLAPLKKISDGSIDIVFVDGRHRVASIMRSMNLLKDGGIIILDNSDRTHYEDAFKLLEDWPLQNTACITNASEFVTPAAIWKKPIS